MLPSIALETMEMHCVYARKPTPANDMLLAYTDIVLVFSVHLDNNTARADEPHTK